MAGGMCGKEGMCGSMRAREMTTEAGGTYPTGMHSCLQLRGLKLVNHMCEWILSHNFRGICTWYFSIFFFFGARQLFTFSNIGCDMFLMCSLLIKCKV